MRKWIGYYQNIVSDNLCDKLIDYSDNVKQLKSSKYASHKEVTKNSEERVKMDDGWFVKGEKFYDDIRKSFQEVIRRYQEKHPDFVCQRHTDFRLNKYSYGGFMSRHVDNIHHSHGQEYGYPQVSSLLFLNDDYKGGQLKISNTTYNTKKGSAIIFPSNFMFPHEVNLVTEGTRYSIVTWLM